MPFPSVEPWFIVFFETGKEPSMGVLHQLKSGFRLFFSGRNGMDALGLFLFWVSMGMNLLSLLLRRVSYLGAQLLYWAAMILLLWVMVRMLSRNLNRRRMENSRFLSLRWQFQTQRRNAKARRADRTHKYFTCKSCKTICRVPSGKGRVEITCPKCGAKIRGKT
jgi:predicted RNA-binding Zn-ribbon protein involved in translation (DUF1610 family)